MKRGDVCDVEMDIKGRGIWLYTVLVFVGELGYHGRLICGSSIDGKSAVNACFQWDVYPVMVWEISQYHNVFAAVWVEYNLIGCFLLRVLLMGKSSRKV